VAGDHQFLVGGNDVASDPRSIGGDPPGSLCIGFGIKLEAKPGEPRCHGFTNGRRVLTDARGKDEAIDAPHRGREHPGKESDAVDEIVEREFGARVGTLKQVSHVVADAGQPFKSAVVIK
jgi:hypothetical protein